MTPNIRSASEVLADIKTLVNAKGYIYALCLIIIDDFHFNPVKMHEIDVHAKLNKNEMLLLFGFLIQQDINFAPPNSPLDLYGLKQRTYLLMNELHIATTLPFIEKMKQRKESSENPVKTMREFFAAQNMFTESIFYAGDGIYDVQFLDFIDQKYQFDHEWLDKNANFRTNEAKAIVTQIKEIHQKKIERITILSIKENTERMIADAIKHKVIDKNAPQEKKDELLSVIEFSQFSSLFETDQHVAKGLSLEKVTEAGWKSFYDGLLNLFTVTVEEFDPELNAETFLKRFSVPDDGTVRNEQFTSVGDFNMFATRPMIVFPGARYFIPMSFPLYEAVYESPYYWMVQDKSYSVQLAQNRGHAGEEVTAALFQKVLPNDQVFKSVKVRTGKDFDTDIDVLCILGNKALAVQVKSKKLTQLSRKGSIDQLEKDFKGAVQDAYQQGLVSRDRILKRPANFFDASGNEIFLSESIDEVYILVVTTENYPSLAHQSLILLQKNESDPFPLVMTVFDLDLIIHYLSNPYELFYYIRQRISLADYYVSTEEMNFLGYHLLHKLRKSHEADKVGLDNQYGQFIDRNYYPTKLGLKISSRGDKIEARWKNKAFDELCNELSASNSAKMTDIIFRMMDWPKETCDKLTAQIRIAKSNMLSSGQTNNFSLINPELGAFGITFIASHENDLTAVMERLEMHSLAKKYQCKADSWIGMASLKSSTGSVDVAFYVDQKWEYDPELERISSAMFGGPHKVVPIINGRKAGRNDPCVCGSGLKYKKCCGRNA